MITFCKICNIIHRQIEPFTLVRAPSPRPTPPLAQTLTEWANCRSRVISPR